MLNTKRTQRLRGVCDRATNGYVAEPASYIGLMTVARQFFAANLQNGPAVFSIITKIPSPWTVTPCAKHGTAGSAD